MMFILRWLLLFLLAVKSHQENDQEVPHTDDQLDLSSIYFGNETLWSSGILDNSTLNESNYNTTLTVDYQPEAETLAQNRSLPDLQYSLSHTEPPLKEAESGFQVQVLQQQRTFSSRQSQEPQVPPPTSPPSETTCPSQVLLQVPMPRSPPLWQLEVPQQPRSPLHRLGVAKVSQVSPEFYSPSKQLWVPDEPGSSHQRLDLIQMHESPLQRLQFAEVRQQPRAELRRAQMAQVPQQPSIRLQQLQMAQWPQRPLYQLLIPRYQAKYSHYQPMISRYQERLLGHRPKTPLFRIKHLRHPQQIRYTR
ncbi:putative uncharacterized protein DDB_G0294196 [Oreochromis niloticus]|uniref:putative uncharacterized protein DDB_G0294196 n=1 Tax=Oreochromis niloticus TaxID=8128 RepID=UPI0003943126|nr:putative uncharacterized protein DDB_G0294196 [Oreochromis niloticus]XP_031598033.1 putative uncharacterized protein DDB_G0294196 [Oreochromis aureus]